MRIYQLFLLAILLFSACEEGDMSEPVNPIDPDRIDFQSPVAGQFNAYQRFTFQCGEVVPDPELDVRLEITEVSDSLIAFSEYQEGSSEIVFSAARTDSGLLIPAGERATSRLLFFYGDDLIRLQAEPTAEVYQQDCVFFDGADKFTGEYVAHAENFQLGPTSMTDLKVVSCVPLILELDGYLLYDKHNLKASFTANNAFDEQRIVTAYILKN